MNGKAGNGKTGSSEPAEDDDPTLPRNGRNPFAEIYEDDRSWERNLPTEGDLKIKPSSIFSIEKLRALIRQRNTDQETYFDLTRRLVAAADDRGVTLAKIDAAVTRQERQDRQAAKAAAVGEKGDSGKENAIDTLIQLGKKYAELFHAPDGQPYVTATIAGHPRTLRINGGTFSGVLLNRFMEKTGRGASIDALKTAALNLAALAKRDSAPKYPVFPRIGTRGGNIYVDRGSDELDAYEIEPAEQLKDGTYRPKWGVIAHPPLKFIRPEGAPIGELPIAKTAEERERDQDGGIEKLHRFLAVPDRNSFVLATSWVLGGYKLEGDKAAGDVTGEGGSGKTSVSRFLCALIDPLPPPQDAMDGKGDRRGHMRAPTSDPWDLAVAAQTTWVQPFDNISKIDDTLADTLCRFSTGGSIRRRSLYGLLDETTLSARRPVLFSSVEDLVVRGDLAGRCLFLRAGRAPGVEMSDEVRLWQEFEAEWPALLGCIFDAVSVGLANQLPDMADPPRLASFANWACRCEVGLGWTPGTFMDAYRVNQVEGAEVVADADPVITAVRDFVVQQRAVGETDWSGPPSELYRQLEVLVGHLSQRGPKWPKRAAELSKRLRSSKSLLAKLGIAVTVGQRTEAAAQLTLSWSPPPPPESAAPAPKAGGRPQAEDDVNAVSICKQPETLPTSLSHGKIIQNVGAVSDASDSLSNRTNKKREGDRGASRESTGAGPADRRRVFRI